MELVSIHRRRELHCPNTSSRHPETGLSPVPIQDQGQVQNNRSGSTSRFLSAMYAPRSPKVFVTSLDCSGPERQVQLRHARHRLLPAALRLAFRPSLPQFGQKYLCVRCRVGWAKYLETVLVLPTRLFPFHPAFECQCPLRAPGQTHNNRAQPLYPASEIETLRSRALAQRHPQHALWKRPLRLEHPQRQSFLALERVVRLVSRECPATLPLRLC